MIVLNNSGRLFQFDEQGWRPLDSMEMNRYRDNFVWTEWYSSGTGVPYFETKRNGRNEQRDNNPEASWWFRGVINDAYVGLRKQDHPDGYVCSPHPGAAITGNMFTINGRTAMIVLNNSGRLFQFDEQGWRPLDSSDMYRYQGNFVRTGKFSGGTGEPYFE